MQKFKQSKFLPFYISVILISLSLLLSYGLLVQDTIRLDRDQVVLRERPESDSKSIVQLDKAQIVHIIKKDQNWMLVRTVDNVQGWLADWLLNNPNLLPTSKLNGQVLNDTVFYQGPDLGTQQIKTITKDTYVEITQESLGWSRVHIDNTYGFIQTKDLYIIDETQVVQNQKTKTVSENGKEIVKVRVSNQGAFDQASGLGEIIYNPQLNEEFEYIKSVYDEYDNEWYLVKNFAGIQMYIESRVSAFVSDSVNHHIDTPAKSLAGATIVIDPGHGGEDPGTIATNGIFEKDFNMNTSRLIKDKLEAAGANVLMTRQEDTWVELIDRVHLSNNNNADAFISIHYDAIEDTSWHGTTTYYFHEPDYDLAVAVNNEINELPLTNNGTAFGNYQVIRDNNQPALLLELGYLTNASDLSVVKTQTYYEQVADALVKGLDTYFKSRSN